MNERDELTTMFIGDVLIKLWDIAHYNLDDTDFRNFMTKKLGKVHAEIILEMGERTED